MLAPWQTEPPVELSREELDTRAGRSLSADDLAVLTTLGIVTPAVRGRYRVAVAHLSVGIGLLDLGFPPDAARAAAEVYAAHGRAIAEELYAVFKKLVWPAYKESGAPPDALREVVERLKPLSVASLVTAYEVAMDDAKREGIARRTGS
jgi:hypothetical protein